MTWNTLRPWASDIAAAIGMIWLCVFGFAAMGYAADYLETLGWLA